MLVLWQEGMNSTTGSGNLFVAFSLPRRLPDASDVIQGRCCTRSSGFCAAVLVGETFPGVTSLASAYHWYRIWTNDGTFVRILERLQVRLTAEGLLDFDTWFVDSKNVRASRAAAGAKKGASRP